jgi:hypothetical protein
VLRRFRRFWSQRLDALAVELARGRLERRTDQDADGQADHPPATAPTDDEEQT